MLIAALVFMLRRSRE